MYKQNNKRIVKVKTFIKNTPSTKHHLNKYINQCRGMLRSPSNIQDGDFCKNSQGP